MPREFIFAGDELKSVDPLKAGKWKKYLDLKAAFYLSYVSSILQALVTERKQYTVKGWFWKKLYGGRTHHSKFQSLWNLSLSWRALKLHICENLFYHRLEGAEILSLSQNLCVSLRRYLFEVFTLAHILHIINFCFTNTNQRWLRWV